MVISANQGLTNERCYRSYPARRQLGSLRTASVSMGGGR